MSTVEITFHTDPLPDTLDSLHNLVIPEGVEAVNPENIHLEGSPGPPAGTPFVPVQGTPSPERRRTDLVITPVATRSPSPAVQAGRVRKAADQPVPDTPGAGSSLKRLKKGAQKKGRPDGTRHSPRFEKEKE